MPDFIDELRVAERAALAAGKWLGQLPLSERAVDSAEGRDIKLAADREAERIILQALSASGRPVLSEEQGTIGQVGTESPYWVVDPLDGTMNFKRGLGLECVSIALWRRSEPLLGVVYDFDRDELFSGLVGHGAWCNAQPIRVSGVDDRGQAVLATGFPVGRDYAADALAAFVGGIQSFKKVRMLGTAALSLAYLASGRLDAYWEDGIRLWDVAAGLALVEAAGGSSRHRAVANLAFQMDVKAAANAALFDREA